MASLQELERERQDVFLAETVSLSSAQTMQAVASEFASIDIRILSDRVSEDADEIARILNERDERAGGVGFMRPHSGYEIYHRAMQGAGSGERWLPFVVVTASSEEQGNRSEFEDFMGKVISTREEQQAILEASRAQQATPGPLARALGWLGMRQV